MILELNARPGLSIQIANNAGLLPRLNSVEAHTTPCKNVDERVTFATENFFARDENRILPAIHAATEPAL